MKEIKVGILGLGTVGGGTALVLQRNANEIKRRVGRSVVVTMASVRSLTSERLCDCSQLSLTQDPFEIVNHPDIDVVVELIGGETLSKELVLQAIANGKHVVTANKALIALHGNEIFARAQAQGVTVAFEAAVAGGIPVIKSLTEGLAANEITRVMGVMNGTCNYILTRMETAGLPYDAVFKEADDLGYLEADPTLDVGGIDAGHKLALLASIAFGTRPDFAGIEIEGIERIEIEDIRQAADMGYRIKLLGVAQRTGRGLEQRMQPCLVPATSPLGQLEGGTNMVVLEGDSVEQIVLRGPGAGEGPTASAVMGDICDLARGSRIPVFGQPAASLDTAPSAKAVLPAPYYLRMALLDKPGALAKIATILGKSGVSIDRMRQYGHSEPSAPVLIVTHKTTRAALDDALADMQDTDVLVAPPVALRIENL